MTTLSTKKVAHFFGKSTFEKQTKQQVATRLLGTIVIEFFFSTTTLRWIISKVRISIADMML